MGVHMDTGSRLALTDGAKEGASDRLFERHHLQPTEYTMTIPRGYYIQGTITKTDGSERRFLLGRDNSLSVEEEVGPALTDPDTKRIVIMNEDLCTYTWTPATGWGEEYDCVFEEMCDMCAGGFMDADGTRYQAYHDDEDGWTY